MRHLITSLVVLFLLAGAAFFSVSDRASTAPSARNDNDELEVSVDRRNPWTHLDANNRRSDFQFAIVTDRTGGRRPGVFTEAVGKINLLQPEFVVSVGDLINGYTEDPGQWALEWSEFESKIADLQMPFFFCAGNHDFSNVPMSKDWKRKFGRSYYHFRYRDVLFVVLNSEEFPRTKEQPYYFSSEQQKWLAKTLGENEDVRWTFVIVHKPAWAYVEDDPDALGWTGIEATFQDRPYTVFAGHVHTYAKFNRKGREYYTLATTGGGSNLSGLAAGKFDHFVWVTMKDEGPVIANILLDGLEDRDVRTVPNPVRKPK